MNPTKILQSPHNLKSAVGSRLRLLESFLCAKKKKKEKRCSFPLPQAWQLGFLILRLWFELSFGLVFYFSRLLRVALGLMFHHPCGWIILVSGGLMSMYLVLS
ncbi:hypothetical protein ERO13_D02G081750v2 [Gossypium hirsutum]|uniref:Uncharacterized protein n=1 Tax=Gossypium darwinii TaxID=34276 RepID=A0A5D2DBZ5_GOSDA|nr:hypothetical protein ERO13_D02G081750v2 [Gossypium hirsutum]TYG78924.1 hypothetical protein ES288_D02G100500v1 [Gossypium darwinii]